ncbi:MAG: hypothetical protein MSG64_20985 [Pyrinomonadaceae bacterium MAG19_C2-C3]|nr:hypothetical protein [Pyrinomonadaceae bacterium MAG19_C2-C3]
MAIQLTPPTSTNAFDHTDSRTLTQDRGFDLAGQQPGQPRATVKIKDQR